MAVTIGATAVVVCSSLTPASAAISSHVMGGIESAIGCPTTKLCVAVGSDGSGHGTAVVVKNGKPGKVKKVSGLSRLNAISCPSSKGCVAVGDNTASTGTTAVVFNSKGSIIAKKKLKVATGIRLTAVSCTSLKSCELAGGDAFSAKPVFVVASWNGTKTSIHKVSAHGGTTPISYGISCSHGNCEAVGSELDPHTVGVAIEIKHGKPGQFVKLLSAGGLTGVSCVSASRCYAVGNFTDPAGIVFTLGDGKATKHATFASAPLGIGCHGSNCIVAGEEVSHTTPIAAGGFNGDLTSIASGTPQAVQMVPASGGYAGIAVKGSFFSAVGAAAKSGSLHSLVTTG